MHWSTDIYHAPKFTYSNVHLLPNVEARPNRMETLGSGFQFIYILGWAYHTVGGPKDDIAGF